MKPELLQAIIKDGTLCLDILRPKAFS
jgi:hypothetical protein